MPKYKIFRDETYVFYVEADSWEAAQEMADDQVCDERELIAVNNKVGIRAYEQLGSRTRNGEIDSD